MKMPTNFHGLVFYTWILCWFFENLESLWQAHCHVVSKLKNSRWLWMKQNVSSLKLSVSWTWNGCCQHISTWHLLLHFTLFENFNANNTFHLHQQFSFDFQKREIFQMSGKSSKKITGLSPMILVKTNLFDFWFTRSSTSSADLHFRKKTPFN